MIAYLTHTHQKKTKMIDFVVEKRENKEGHRQKLSEQKKGSSAFAPKGAVSQGYPFKIKVCEFRKDSKI